jgi:hypothetical protein
VLRTEPGTGHRAVERARARARDTLDRGRPPGRRRQVGDDVGVALVDADHALPGALEPLAQRAPDTRGGAAQRNRPLFLHRR